MITPLNSVPQQQIVVSMQESIVSIVESKDTVIAEQQRALTDSATNQEAQRQALERKDAEILQLTRLLEETRGSVAQLTLTSAQERATAEGLHSTITTLREENQRLASENQSLATRLDAANVRLAPVIAAEERQRELNSLQAKFNANSITTSEEINRLAQLRGISVCALLNI